MTRIHRTIQKGLNDPDNHDDVVTHLEPDILDCEVKWGLGSESVAPSCLSLQSHGL